MTPRERRKALAEQIHFLAGEIMDASPDLVQKCVTVIQSQAQRLIKFDGGHEIKRKAVKR